MSKMHKLSTPVVLNAVLNWDLIVSKIGTGIYNNTCRTYNVLVLLLVYATTSALFIHGYMYLLYNNLSSWLV